MPTTKFFVSSPENLDNIIKHPASGRNSVYRDQKLLGQHLNINSNYLGVLGSLKEKEFAMHTASVDSWTRKFDSDAPKSKAKAGQVWFADLGMAYKPEIAYKHPVLIVEVIGDLLFIVPCTSSPKTVIRAFHPIDNPKGDKRYRKITETEGFLKDSTANLTNVRVISSSRLKSKMHKQKVEVQLDPLLFEEIKSSCLLFCFPIYAKKLKNLEVDAEDKNGKILTLESELKILRNQYYKLEKKYNKLASIEFGDEN